MNKAVNNRSYSWQKEKNFANHWWSYFLYLTYSWVNRVFLGFTGFHLVLLGFTGLERCFSHCFFVLGEMKDEGHCTPQRRKRGADQSETERIHSGRNRPDEAASRRLFSFHFFTFPFSLSLSLSLSLFLSSSFEIRTRNGGSNRRAAMAKTHPPTPSPHPPKKNEKKRGARGGKGWERGGLRGSLGGWGSRPPPLPKRNVRTTNRVTD